MMTWIDDPRDDLINSTRKQLEYEMKWGKDWGPGWRYFHCEECGYKFSEKCRDCTSPSGSICKNCHQQVSPVDYEMHLEWPVDAHKNLLVEQE